MIETQKFASLPRGVLFLAEGDDCRNVGAGLFGVVGRQRKSGADEGKVQHDHHQGGNKQYFIRFLFHDFIDFLMIDRFSKPPPSEC